MLAALCCFLLITVYCVCFREGAYAANERGQTVYLGGFPIGLELKPKGVIVVGTAPVETELGSVVRSLPLRGGDILESIDNRSVQSAADIAAILADTPSMSVEVGIKRGTASHTYTIGLIREDMTGEKRMGLQVRESVTGIGTVSFVKPDGAFGCLGHPILLENGSMAPCDVGFAYECKILGVQKGTRGKAGELKGAFTGSVSCGTLHKNCGTGVYGTLPDHCYGTPIEVASRKSVRIGKVKIVTTVGEEPQEYSAEIVKTTVQNSVSDKSMILRITDKRLLSATGGIVQGMSGSPIVQDGKLVGAVTHVFVSDPTKGYGIYADWMLQN